MSEEPRNIDDVTHKTRSVISTAVTSAAIVALFAALTFVPTRTTTHDAPILTHAATSEEVAAKQTMQYCPAKMDIADDASYGDKEFHTSTGDLSSSRGYAAFGSIFHAQADTLGAVGGTDGLVLEGPQNGATDDASAFIAIQDKADAATLLDTRLLSAGAGTGSTGTVTSWATKGDIPGAAAARCVTTALTQRFLVPATTTGNTQQLVVTNPSDKPTSVQIAVWGTQHGKVTLATSSVLTVAADAQSDMLLNAAAPDEQALYVTVSSQDAPIAAIVRSVSMDGLTPRGNDYITPLSDMATTQTILLPTNRHKTTLMAYAQEHTNVTLSWISDHGLIDLGKFDIEGGKATIHTIEERPKDARAILAQSDRACALAATLTVEGDDKQQDFAVVNAGTAYAQSALAVTPDTSAGVTLVNMANQEAKVTFEGYDAHGEPTGEKTVRVDADSAATLKTADLGRDVAAVRVDDADTTIIWGMFPTNKAVSDAHVAALAFVPATGLIIPKQLIHAVNDQQIVR